MWAFSSFLKGDTGLKDIFPFKKVLAHLTRPLPGLAYSQHGAATDQAISVIFYYVCRGCG